MVRKWLSAVRLTAIRLPAANQIGQLSHYAGLRTPSPCRKRSNPVKEVSGGKSMRRLPLTGCRLPSGAYKGRGGGKAGRTSEKLSRHSASSVGTRQGADS